jgi:hypothetical protein
MRIFSRFRERRFFTVIAELIRVGQERLTLSTSRDSPSACTRWKKDFRSLVLACLVFAQPSGAISQAGTPSPLPPMTDSL